MSARPDAAPAAGYERRDARLGPILVAAALLAAAIVLAHFATRGVIARLGRKAHSAEEHHPMEGERRAASGPLLQADPRDDALRHAEREREALATYGWIDPVGGVVRLPIERAMELVLQEGLPARAEPGRQDGERR